MNVMQTQTCGLAAGTSGAESPHFTDLYIARGRIGRTRLSAGCYTWHEVLATVAEDLTRRGEDAAVRARLKTRVTSVRAFLRERYGILTGPREFWHDSRLTPDRADLRDFLGAIKRVKRQTVPPEDVCR